MVGGVSLFFSISYCECKFYLSSPGNIAVGENVVLTGINDH